MKGIGARPFYCHVVLAYKLTRCPFALILARMECDWANYNSVIAAISAIKDRNQQMAAAVAQGFPARISLVSNVSTMMFDLMATVSTPEGFGEFSGGGFVTNTFDM